MYHTTRVLHLQCKQHWPGFVSEKADTPSFVSALWFTTSLAGIAARTIILMQGSEGRTIGQTWVRGFPYALSANRTRSRDSAGMRPNHYTTHTTIGIARGGRGPSPPIKIALTIKKLWQHSLAMFRCSFFFSAITHITVINNNINDNKGLPGPLTNNLGAPTNNYGDLGPLTDNQGTLGPLTENQGAPGPLTNDQGAPNQKLGGP